MLKNIPRENRGKAPRKIENEVVEIETPWGYFDGVS